MPIATLTSKGQITLPKSVREALHVHAGDKIDFTLDDHGTVHLQKHGGRVRELHGILYNPNLKSPGQPDDYSEALEEDDARIRAASRRKQHS
jgi:antitoxin PrlF